MHTGSTLPFLALRAELAQKKVDTHKLPPLAPVCRDFHTQEGQGWTAIPAAREKNTQNNRLWQCHFTCAYALLVHTQLPTELPALKGHLAAHANCHALPTTLPTPSGSNSEQCTQTLDILEVGSVLSPGSPARIRTYRISRVSKVSRKRGGDKAFSRKGWAQWRGGKQPRACTHN